MLKTIILLSLLHSYLINNAVYGISYNQLGTARITSNKLTLSSHLNISYLIESRHILERSYQRSLSLCITALKNKKESNHIHFYCDQSLNSINGQLKEINKKYNIIHHYLGQRSHRRRRRLSNSLSTALNCLTGTPDAEDAQYYSDSIYTLIDENKQTQTLLKSQVQIISSTIRNFNNSFGLWKITRGRKTISIKLIH